MADEGDYTQMWSGVYTSPPTSGDLGLYLLEEESPKSAAQKAYVQGSRRLGHPGKVTSTRAGRSAVDDILWDPRPPHYAADAPNEHSHIYLDPETRGPALYSAGRSIGDFGGAAPVDPAQTRPTDHFRGHAAPSCRCSTMYWSVEIILLVVIVAVFVAMCLVDAVGRRIGREVEKVLREAIFNYV